AHLVDIIYSQRNYPPSSMFLPRPRALCPIASSLPISVGPLCFITWMQVLSCTLLRSPISIHFTSPRVVVLNHTLLCLPWVTSPIISALGAIKTESSYWGLLSRNS